MGSKTLFNPVEQRARRFLPCIYVYFVIVCCLVCLVCLFVWFVCLVCLSGLFVWFVCLVCLVGLSGWFVWLVCLSGWFVWSGLVWSGLVWSGLVWSGLVWSGLVWSVCLFVKLSRQTSLTKDFAAILKTSGAILGTRSAYSPTNHKILALAIGT
jgi:hypothetical protein